MAKSSFKLDHALGKKRLDYLILVFSLTCADKIGLFLERDSGAYSERRQAEASRIREKHPDRVPVRISSGNEDSLYSSNSGNTFPCNQACGALCRYLVPADLTVGQFVYVVRKRIKLSPEKAIFVFVKNTLPPTAALMSVLYEENKDEDGFLYMTYSGENTFGFH
ncbi:hypothetical protein SADUNF_Sadunf11G0003100 [Salix dunnii]|uniref:Autophagy-related protein n=1 Tax=Salix dunnii TaxID=1413687 RepID=A0A835JJL0_9ROSI|nr:hypothetical protein SADUNF_Sadunf11G0003100 [Salix dunnii]